VSTDAWGIDDGWQGTDGQWHPTPSSTIDAIRAAIGEADSRPVWVVRPGGAEPLQDPCHLRLEDGTDLGEVRRLPDDLPLGLHSLTPLHGGPVTTVLCGPGRCHLPDGLREWGVTVQVPTARSRGSWGIGDLADVRAVAEWVTGAGGQVVALSPLHAPTPVPPIPASPYYPSSRRWRSPLLIRVDEVGGADPVVRGHAARARALLDRPVVDRDACWAEQRPALEHLWQQLGEGGRAHAAWWRREQGPDLDRWATFCALAEQHGRSWQGWPDELRHPDAPAVLRAARALADRVGFHCWVQQLAAEQLEAARGTGARLVQDLAVGVDPHGFDAWRWQDLVAAGFSIGAPPDQFETEGQTWGLPPWIAPRLRDAGYRPLAELLRASMVAGGGLRIDHVMGLTRLFWVPEQGGPADGAYVRFAGHELLELVALESARAEAIVVGEDLGTVEDGLRDELARRRLLSTKVVWFERVPPEAWPHLSLGMATTHDLPTVAGLCTGRDGPPEMRAALERLVGPVDGRPPADVAWDVHRRLGASPAALALATMEDLLGVVDRPNVPGTTEEQRPNWSVGLPVAVDDLPADPTARAGLAALAPRATGD
jgi:4-alpha-glucanotransferase